METDFGPARFASLQRAAVPALLDQLRALRAVLAVARHGTTVGAAEAIHVSQPAVTRAVGLLEATYGHQLFLRTTRGMVPTTQGERLASRAGACMELLTRGAREAVTIVARKSTRVDGAVDRFAQRVTPSQLRALLSISDCGSESRAALQLGISQPAVHAALLALEQLLDVRIFYKSSAGTRLMPPGEALLLRVRQAVGELRVMETEFSAWSGSTRGQIVVGMLPLSVPIFLPRATRAFMRQYPDVDVRIIDGTYETLASLLQSADVDLVAGALRSGVPHADLQALELFVDDLVIIANSEHPCLRRSGLELADLLQWPWVAPLPETPADRLLQSLFDQHGLPAPSRQLCAGSPMMTLAYVLQSDLLAIASRGHALLDDHGGRIRIVPVQLPTISRRIGLLVRTLTEPSPPLLAFLEACREATQALPGARYR